MWGSKFRGIRKLNFSPDVRQQLTMQYVIKI